MMSRFLAVLFVAGLAVPGASADMQPLPFAIYYSFDQTPTSALVAEIQTEFTRITEPAGLTIQWHEIGSDNGEFSNIFIVHFRGSCSMQPAGKEAGLGVDERSLAETSIEDGHVLPFADVQCDLLRRYLNSGMRGRIDPGLVMAKAIARVTAHELYHMLTGSTNHARKGVSQAEYSFDDLTGPHFEFGNSEAAWLRARVSPVAEALLDVDRSGGR